MSDRWAEIGISTFLEFTYGEVLQDFAGEGMTEYVKNFFKSKMEDTAALARLSSVRFAVFKALKKFLFVVEQELIETGDREPRDYAPDLKRFLRDEATMSVLASAFGTQKFDLQANVFEERWYRLSLTPLPSDFDWEIVARRYARTAKKIYLGTVKLNDMLPENERAAVRTHDPIALTLDLPEYDLQRGQVGTIVKILEGGDAFEVAFGDREGLEGKSIRLSPKQILALHVESVPVDSNLDPVPARSLA